VFNDIKVIDMNGFYHDYYRFAFQAFKRSCLGRDLCNSIPAIDIQTKYCYPVLTSDGHCIRIARISVDWTAGWLVY